MIVRQGGVVLVGGALVGLAIALAGSRLIESLLYGSAHATRQFLL
jgi:hypothetical protein